MLAYTYVYYSYFNKSIDATKEHRNHFILNWKPIFNITSLSKFMDDTFTSLPKLFVDETIKNG